MLWTSNKPLSLTVRYNIFNLIYINNGLSDVASREYIMNETLSVKLNIEDSINRGIEINFDNIETKLNIEKK